MGSLFALQEYVTRRSWGYSGQFGQLLLAWGVHFLLWGLISQAMWWKFRLRIRESDLHYILTRFLPLSLVVSVLEEAVWVACFPRLPSHLHFSGYFRRLEYYLDSELVDNLVIFWATFLLFRGIGYYEKYREEENLGLRLESELTNAKLRALRMQLNPHFLFNTLNSISSLMRSDPDTADQVLERLSSMLRMTLQRDEAPLIRLAEEIDFIQLYQAIQKVRLQSTVHHYVAVSPEVLDALVPAMILQPIVENAYVHGVMKSCAEGFVGIEAQNSEGQLRICVRNSGPGMRPSNNSVPGREHVGISNVRARLDLLYGSSYDFQLGAFPDGEVHAVFLLPLTFQPSLTS